MDSRYGVVFRDRNGREAQIVKAREGGILVIRCGAGWGIYDPQKEILMSWDRFLQDFDPVAGTGIFDGKVRP